MSKLFISLDIVRTHDRRATHLVKINQAKCMESMHAPMYLSRHTGWIAHQIRHQGYRGDPWQRNEGSSSLGERTLV